MSELTVTVTLSDGEGRRVELVADPIPHIERSGPEDLGNRVKFRLDELLPKVLLAVDRGAFS